MARLNFPNFSLAWKASRSTWLVSLPAYLASPTCVEANARKLPGGWKARSNPGTRETASSRPRSCLWAIRNQPWYVRAKSARQEGDHLLRITCWHLDSPCENAAETSLTIHSPLRSSPPHKIQHLCLKVDGIGVSMAAKYPAAFELCAVQLGIPFVRQHEPFSEGGPLGLAEHP